MRPDADGQGGPHGTSDGAAGPRLHGGARATEDLRVLRRAHGPVRLHRHLRAGPPRRRRAAASAATSRGSSGSSGSPSCATRAATSSPTTAGRTASDPRPSGPRQLDLAWRSVETNQVGTDDFVDWARGVGVEPMMAVNLGTRGVQEAIDLLLVLQRRGRHVVADRRVKNGHTEPHDIRVWCLGNEMDGPWQMGHKTAEEYARVAEEAARAMRRVDPDLELVACGSSNRGMPTFGTWERVVLERVLRPRRPHLRPRLLRARRRRRRLLPRERRGHAPLHRVRRRHRRPRGRGQGLRQADHGLLRRVERVVPEALPRRAAPPRSARPRS